MSIDDVIDLHSLIKFCNLYGIKNVPYKFFGIHKQKLDKLKVGMGYPESISIKELIYRQTTMDVAECLNCKQPTNYSSSQNSYKKYCSSRCCSLYNKDVITNKRIITMSKNLSDEKWAKKYKEKISLKSREYHQSDIGKVNNKIQSTRLKEKIKSGEFTPNITNSWTRWTAEYNGKKFRSMFDALFQCYADELSIPVIYEGLRIPYTYDGDHHIYIVDFVDTHNRQVYEIKPISLVENDVNKAKASFANQWCIDNKYTYNLITENDLKEYLNIIKEHEFAKVFLRKYPKWI